ncbi:hypothetical protein DHX103_09470 [Planococcus sp. X10-3]|uniref:hypothetical protein n=1 Tax=Planococcus sp. X10-3 TaxID=3061240 RepID=UPI003BB1C39D
MFKNVFLIGLTLLIGVMLIGCNSEISGESADESSEGSYGGYLIVNGREYVWQGDIENEEFTVAEKIGEVDKKVPIEVMPKENLSSNILEVGEEIFTSNEDSNVIIVKRKFDGEYDKFTEGNYHKEENN